MIYYIKIQCENGQELYLKCIDGIGITYHDAEKNEIGIPDCPCWSVEDHTTPPFVPDVEYQEPPQNENPLDDTVPDNEMGNE